MTDTTQVAKKPSKKSLAAAIFNKHLVERAAGKYANDRAFRVAVLTEIQASLGVTLASASTMYNTAKIEAEVLDPTLKLGRENKQAASTTVPAVQTAADSMISQTAEGWDLEKDKDALPV